MSAEFIFGVLSTAVGLSAWVPQVAKSWRTRRVNDLSLGTLSIILTNAILSALYGFFAEAVFIVVTNVIVGCLVASLVILKVMVSRSEASG